MTEALPLARSSHVGASSTPATGILRSHVFYVRIAGLILALVERHFAPPFSRLFFLMIRRPPRSTLFPYTTALPISAAARNSRRFISTLLEEVFGSWPIVSCA